MGLLTNPTTRQKLANVITTHDNKLCFLCYVIGVCWFLALAYVPMNDRVYFSENALLPGLVETNIFNDNGASNFYRELKEELRDTDETKDYKYRIPSDWLATKFRELGIDTYVQNYTFRYPASVLKEQTFSGKNVYGILRAPRAASTEAVVMSVPYRPLKSEQDKTNVGLSLMYGLANAFRKNSYWSKDIIFLVTEHNVIGMQAWLSSYHNSENEYIQAGELQGRSGSIQAAVNLEIGMDQINRFNIKTEGLNGQLPNLDLVNTAVRLCKKEGFLPTLQKRADYYNQNSFEGWLHALKTMLYMMWNQAHGAPSGVHGLFHRYHIEALTLQGVKMKKAKHSHGFLEMERVLEGLFRSLNNLLERFHQSFFFYLLPSTERYISIGVYMPPFGLIAAPVLIKAISLWISVSKAMTTAEEKRREKKRAEKEKKYPGKSEDIPSPPVEDINEPSANESSVEDEEEDPDGFGFLSVLPSSMMGFLLGICLQKGPQFFIETATAFRMKPADGVAMGVMAIHLSALVFPKLMQRKIKQKGRSVAFNWKLQKCVALIMLGLVLGAISVMNISLAVFLATVLTPVATLVKPRKSKIAVLLQIPFLLATSPVGLLFIGNTVYEALNTTAKTLDFIQIAGTAWENSSSALLLGVVDGHMFGNWTYSLLSMAVFPNWLMFWAVSWGTI